MSRLLAALFEPGPLIGEAQREAIPSSASGLALLLDGRLVEYRAFSGRGGWPDLGTPAPEDSPSPWRLLGALGLHLTGNEAAFAEYEALASEPRDTGILATLLLSILLSDFGRGSDAIELLRERTKLTRAPFYLALLRLQLGLRLFEVAETPAAITETAQAKSHAMNAKPAAWSRVLENIAAYNGFAYEWHARRILQDRRSLPLRTDALALVRNSLLVADAGGAFLDQTFERGLADPYARSVTFQATDPVETPLRGALTRAELLADWNEVQHARTLLGRYLVLSRLGTTGGIPPAALELLRRARDEKGLEASSRTVSRLGPVWPLHPIVSALLEGEFAHEPATSMILLAEGAHLLTQEEASKGAADLMGNSRLYEAQWNRSSKALAELVRNASPASQTEAARFVRAYAEHAAHGPLIQELTRVVSAIRWNEVTPDESAAWFRFIRTAYGTQTDAHFVAAAALAELAAVEPREADAVLHERFVASPSEEVLAVAFGAFGTPPKWARADAWSVVRPHLVATRSAAAEGRFGFGGLDTAALAVDVLRRQSRNLEGWNELVDFLLDPQVGVTAKTGAIELLSRPNVRIPREAAVRLREGLASLRGVDEQLGTAPQVFEGALLRLALRLGGLGRDEILVRLLRLSGQPSALSRAVAARTAGVSARKLGASVSATLALTLAHDPDPDVRGAAAYALAQLDPAEEMLSAATRERLYTLVSEPGVVVPLNALRGMLAALEANRQLPSDLLEAVLRVATQHPSRRVRDAAVEVADQADASG